MPGKLTQQIKLNKPFASKEQEVFLNVLRTADHLTRGFEALLKPHNLSHTTYNVLRVLRGAMHEHAGGLPCNQIGERMLTREPDVTRLLDRLETRGLIIRTRQVDDRRVVLAKITEQGRAILKQLDEPVVALHSKQLGHLSRPRLQMLSDLLEAAREQNEP
jgi:DNA-binding MarR family transcriptional regulator